MFNSLKMFGKIAQAVFKNILLKQKSLPVLKDKEWLLQFIWQANFFCMRGFMSVRF